MNVFLLQVVECMYVCSRYVYTCLHMYVHMHLLLLYMHLRSCLVQHTKTACMYQILAVMGSLLIALVVLERWSTCYKLSHGVLMIFNIHFTPYCDK